MVCPFARDRFGLVWLWSTPSLRMTVQFGFGMSLHSGLLLGSVSGASLHSGPPLVWGDGFDLSFHSGRPPMLSRSFQHLLWLTGATRDSFVLEIPVVLKEERRKSNVWLERG